MSDQRAGRFARRKALRQQEPLRRQLQPQGRIDAEFGSTTPTKQREEVVDFTITSAPGTGR